MKAIISDFDGTLFDTKIKENIIGVNKFVNEGNIFVLATGRTYQSIKKMVLEYKIPYHYLICSDGMCIYNQNDNLIYEKYLEKDFVDKIINFCLNYNSDIVIKYDNNNDICDFNEKVSRILISASIDVKKQLCDLLNNSFDDVYAYLSTNWLNISSINSDKTVAIKYIKDLLTLDDIYVIGNDVNDYAMIKYFNGYLINHNISSFDELLKKIG